jgi:hypothetical protein
LDVSATLTTSYQRFQGTATVNSSATELGILFIWTPTGTAGANDWVEITGVQIEVGSVATTLRKAGGTLQGELAACQRYYEKSFYIGTAPAQNAGSDGSAIIPLTSDYAQFFIPFKVTKRTAPSITLFNPSAANANPRNFDDAADLGAATARFIGETSFSVVAAKNAAGTTGDVIGINWTANSEL